MYIVLPELYHRLSEELVDKIAGRGYFSGTIELEYGDVHCRLVLSVVMYYEERDGAQGVERVLSDLVAVWWEFHTYTSNEEIINDLSFDELRKYVAQIMREY